MVDNFDSSTVNEFVASSVTRSPSAISEKPDG